MGTYAFQGIILICGLGIVLGAVCKEGQRAEIPGVCGSYMECTKDGQMVVKDCEAGQLFDATKLECDLSSRVSCEDAVKDCVEGKVYPHPKSCRLYYYCRDGRLVLQFCSALEIFDPSTSSCRYGSTCEKANDVTTESCKDGKCAQCTEGDVKPGTACNRYRRCDLGRWTERKCPVYHRFDPEKKKCVWSFEYTCPETVDLLTPTGVCRDGDVRADDDCSKYEICKSASWARRSCPPGYLFDAVKLECVNSNSVSCLSCSGEMPDAESCRYYYSCQRGEKVRQSCGLFGQWDGVTKKCVYWGANCFPGDKCVEQGKKTPTSNCKEYDECVGGNVYRKSCGFSRIFDSEKADCVWVLPWHKCDDKHLTPECTEGEAKPLSCDKYAKCVNGRWAEEQCASGQTYANGECVSKPCFVEKKSCREYTINGVDLECVDGEVFDENVAGCRTGTCDRSKRDSGDCKEGERQPVDKSCKRYRECKNGQFVEASCADCKNFNPQSAVCSFVWDYPCKGDDPTPNPPTDPTTTKPTDPPTKPTDPPTKPPTPKPTDPPTRPPTPTPTDPPTKPTDPPTKPTDPPTKPPTPKPTDPPRCKEGARIPKKGECKTYYECTNGKFIENSCFWLRKFDSVELKCVWYGAHCAE